MKLTGRQALDLFVIAVDSTRISGNAFAFSHEDRLHLVNTILAQQDRDGLIELDAANKAHANSLDK